MKFWEIFRFEFGYQMRRPWPWLFMAVLLILNFLMTRDGSVSEVLFSDFFLNSPFGIAKTTVFGSLIWLVMAAAIAGDAAARDVASGMYPLVYTTPISKVDYLGGRFLAAFVLNALILLAVQVGILLGVYLPGVDPALIGPFRPTAFLTAYVFIALPNGFVATSIQFWVASRSGRTMSGYFGSFLLVFMGFFVASVVLFRRGLGTLLDPIGIRFVVEDMAHLWTPIEKNWRLIELEGTVLTNRLLWVSIGLIGLIASYLSFGFSHTVSNSWWIRLRQIIKRNKKKLDVDSLRYPPIAFPESQPIFTLSRPRTIGLTLHARQTFAIAWDSFRYIATSWAGRAMLFFIPLLTIPVVLDQMESNGVPLIPTTPLVVAQLTGSLSDELSRWVIIPFLLVFFAGELVWREREAGMGEITSTLPVSDWVPLLGKFLGLSLVLILFLILETTAGILAQTIRDYNNYEIDVYLKIMLGLQLADYLLFTLLAFAVHVVVDQKYIGHLVAIIAFVFIALSTLFGIEHNLLIFGSSPGWTYTHMRGFSASLGPWFWFKLYWAAWALLFAVMARLFWVRGMKESFAARIKLARHRFTGSTAWVAAFAVVFIVGFGGFIFYNTNVRNKYLTASEMKNRAAQYERQYGKFADSPQPHVTAAKLNIEIYPDQQSATIRGMYYLVNRSSVPIDSIHVVPSASVETEAVRFDRPATNVLTDEKLFHRIYKLKQPLEPGDSLRLAFQVKSEPRGFRENGIDASIVPNGSNFTNKWLPTIGYQTSRDLITASDRRAYGLKPRLLLASLYDSEARKKRIEGIALEVIIGTDRRQVAVAPGALHRSWTKGERSYFHYSTDGPIGSEWDFFSANYAVHQEIWESPNQSGKPVSIRIFHHPDHKSHLARMIRAIRASLDYYSREFGPYRYNHLSFVERPGNGAGMHAEATMITHGEGFTSWNPDDNPGSHDHPSAIVAHEMGHQWNVPIAPVEGAPVMSESIAWYYGMKVVENRGPAYIQALLDYMRQPYPYPPIRRGEPLLRGLDPYLSYRRGPFALFALSKYIGDKPINHALRLMLEKHRPNDAPLATTLDLYDELGAVTPDSLHYLLHDLFEVNTYWELKTTHASAQQTRTGAWEVALDVEARKMVTNEKGVETTVPMNDWVEVGFFAEAGKGVKSAQPLYWQKHRIRSGKQTIKVSVPNRPVLAGIDPNHLLIDLKLNDNFVNTVQK